MKLRARAVGAVVAGLLWLAALALLGTVALEMLLRFRHSRATVAAASVAAADTSRRANLNRAYAPFNVQHLNPQYLFFFPLDPAERVALGNDICSVDSAGFREPGPAHAAGRKLAFFLGGSAAFGHYASSNRTTITSYLNGMQDEFFFVNAGVPSWNSTQELFRLAFEILDYHPALVVAYDGANDVALIKPANSRTKTGYPAGTPESFEALENLVDDILADAARPAPVSLLSTLLPELTERLRRFRQLPEAQEPVAALPKSVLDAAVSRYLRNQTRMHDLAVAAGARFISIFQPIAGLHRAVDPRFDPHDFLPTAVRFHRSVVDQWPRSLEFHDFGNVFDQHFTSVPVAIDDISDETVFVDQVHLYDPGNEIIAMHVLQSVRSSGPMSSTRRPTSVPNRQP